jgi:glycosyltransferase involved in cell wall biosynthesis
VYAGRLRDALAGDPTQRHLVVSLFDAPEAALRADVRLGVPSGLLRRMGLDGRAALALHQAVRRERADVVVAHGGEPLKYVVAAGVRVPSVYYKVGLSSPEIERPSRTRLYRTLAKRVTRVVGVSQAILEQSHVVLGVPRDRLLLVANGRDPATYHPPSGEERRTHPPLLLFVGQLEPGKRPEMFLDVVRALRSRGAVFASAMVGDGPLRTRLERDAAALGVDMLGVRTDVPELLRTSSVLVMTSAANTEGMPGVLVEAGLSGLAVVATPAAGVADVVADGETGFVVSSDRPEDLAAKVELLLEDPELMCAMGTRARTRCETNFSLDTTARLWHALIDELTSEPTAG